MRNVFLNLGLVQLVDKKYKLTPAAESLLKNPSKEAVFEILNERIFGIEEAMSLIETSETPISENDLWNTNAQASFRLLWLWNLEKIQRTEDGKYTKAE